MPIIDQRRVLVGGPGIVACYGKRIRKYSALRAEIRAAFAILALWCCSVAAAPDISANTLTTQLAVIVNDRDPLSVEIAEYYRAQRHIPLANIIHVNIEPRRQSLSAAAFTALRDEVVRRTPAQVQFYALTWVQPYRVECMSITSAFAFGFDSSYCSNGCTATRLSPYFNAVTRQPRSDLGIRPTMSIAALNFAAARALIDRGVHADGSRPRDATAYLVSTPDAKRNVRASTYPDADMLAGSAIRIRLSHWIVFWRRDVMFYFTGGMHVPLIGTNRFLPGAVADHLTSYGGDLLGRNQMSSLRWLEAGATGSYGTVVEPCNINGKFPNPGLMIRRYVAGETLIEAYWKSVAMPGQGIFIGEPLARPFASPPHSSTSLAQAGR